MKERIYLITGFGFNMIVLGIFVISQDLFRDSHPVVIWAVFGLMVLITMVIAPMLIGLGQKDKK